MAATWDVPARYGRAQPFGQPVIRITIESFLRPLSSNTFSTLSIRTGKYCNPHQTQHTPNLIKITYPFRLRHRQAASGERHARRAAQSQSRELEIVHVILSQNPLHVRQVFIRNIGDEDVLIRRQPESPLVDTCKLLKAFLELFAWFVLNATIFDEHGEVMAPVGASIPAKVVDIAVKREWARRFESISEELFDFEFVVVESHSVNRVL